MMILVGHVLDRLAELTASSVHCCITSPPYWGLRDYKTEPLVWGGVPECEHEWNEGAAISRSGGTSASTLGVASGGHAMSPEARERSTTSRFVEAPPAQYCPCGAWRGSLGLEPTIELYLAHMVEVFQAVKRVLRDDGTCWVNLGDSYSASSTHGGDDKRGPMDSAATQKAQRAWISDDLPAGNLCQMPTRFALAMQADGWILRSRIIWAKGISFCDSYSGSVMPESVNGWRWERCREIARPTIISGLDKSTYETVAIETHRRNPNDSTRGNNADWSDCPGCPKCEPNGGYVLRKGSWRPTSAYEEILMFAKMGSYYCDAEAVREGSSENTHSRGLKRDPPSDRAGVGHEGWVGSMNRDDEITGRNLRNVWCINPQPFSLAHFATFPEKLIEPIIKAATSDRGVCPECGAPWCRVVESERIATRPTDTDVKHSGIPVQQVWGNRDHGRHLKESTTLGWRASCACINGQDVPATILDPFLGSGTTALVSKKLGRGCIGIELNADYAEMARKRVADYAPLFSGEMP